MQYKITNEVSCEYKGKKYISFSALAHEYGLNEHMVQKLYRGNNNSFDGIDLDTLGYQRRLRYQVMDALEKHLSIVFKKAWLYEIGVKAGYSKFGYTLSIWIKDINLNKVIKYLHKMFGLDLKILKKGKDIEYIYCRAIDEEKLEKIIALCKISN